MAIEKFTEDSRMTIKADGRLDAVTSPDMEKILKEIPSDLLELVIDLSGLEYISSAGLRVLLSAQKNMAKQGSMKLIHVSDVIMEIFEVTGFVDILTIE